jgi:hypothetical protein
VLLLHQVHQVAGAQEDAFDDSFRDEYMPALAKSEGSRLLWYLRLSHGSGQAYTVVSITGCRDAGAWEELAERVRSGDLADWSAKVDAMRHSTVAKVIQPVSWSPLQEIDLATVPTDGSTHKNSLFMEDTAWPFAGGLRAYLDKAGTLYDHTLSSQKEEGTGMIEVILWQRVVNTKAVMWMLGHDLPPEASAPGTWLHDALEVRDRWESRLLRSAAWSPLY